MRIEVLAALAAGLSPVQLLTPSAKGGEPRPDRSTSAAEPDHAHRRRQWMDERTSARKGK